MIILNQQTNNIFRTFHSIIITAILLFILAGCGYKTPPVYVPDKNQTDSNLTCESR